MKNNNFKKLDMKLLANVLFSLMVLPVFAQNPGQSAHNEVKQVQNTSLRSVSGKVIDGATKKDLPGVRIQAYNNSQYAAMTDEQGLFTLMVPDFVSSLSFQADGYGLIVSPIAASGKQPVLYLYSEAFSESYTHTMQATKKKVAILNDLNADLSVDQQIQTQLGGDMRTMVRSGQKAMGSMMLMNGIQSLAANAQPLVVVDGVILDMQYNRPSIHDGFYNNLLANISVSDIDKVTVLKNGTALYGAKGGNGVLLIETKRSASMATKIDVNVSTNFEQIPGLTPVMNATDYRYYASELLGSTGTKLTEFKFLKSDPNYYYYKQYNNETDWKEEVYQEAFTQLYGINVQGGDEIASYNLSVGYASANSTLKNSEMSRFNLRFNTDIVLSDHIDVRFDASYSDVNRNLRDDGVANDFKNSTITSVGLLASVKSPFLSPYQFDITGGRTRFLADSDDYLDEVLGTEVSLANPTALLEYAEGLNKNVFGNRMITLAITPKIELSKNASLKEHFSYSLMNTNANYYTPINGMPSLIIEDVAQVENVAKGMASHSNSFFSDTRFEWNRTRKSHSIQATGGVRYMKDAYNLTMLQGYNTGNDKTPNIGTGLSYKTTYGEDDNTTTLTYYAMGDYNYKQTYFLSGGVSMEASSRFGMDVESGVNAFGVPWGLFPSVQGAWLMTSEPWFTPNPYVNFLKLNVGYDISGNDDLDCTATKSYFSGVRYLNAISGIVLENIGNTTLQWETTKRATAGADVNLFNNRLSLSANAFSSKTDNLLSLKQLHFVGGLDKLWSNDGVLKNTGYDVSFRYKLLNANSVKMEVGASLAHYNNTIETLPGDESSFTTDYYGATILSQVGSPVGLFYGYKTDGVYSTTEEALQDAKYIVLKNGARKYFGAGDMNFVSDDKEVNDDDRQVIGDPNPDFYGTMFANVHVNRFTLSALFNYSLGNDVFNYQRIILEGGSGFYNQSTALNNRWTTEGQVTDIPQIQYEDPMGNSRFSDRWIEDGSYLRLKSLTLSYQLPVYNTYMQTVTIWGAANNLMTITNYLGGDPEFSAGNNVLLQGIDRGLLPQGVSLSFGLKINI